jgi:hypothetical protein
MQRTVAYPAMVHFEDDGIGMSTNRLLLAHAEALTMAARTDSAPRALRPESIETFNRRSQHSARRGQNYLTVSHDFHHVLPTNRSAWVADERR